jgi:hypothetical protein
MMVPRPANYEEVVDASANYFFRLRTVPFATLATRNLRTVLAGIPIFCWVFGFKSRACLPRLFDQFAKAGQNELAVLFNRFVSKDAQRIEEYSGGLLIGLGCFSKSELKFRFGHL